MSWCSSSSAMKPLGTGAKNRREDVRWVLSDCEEERFCGALGGATLALPALEAMAPSRAHAGALPAKRFVMMYGGMSLGADNNPDLVVPDNVGPGYDLKRGLLPIGSGPLPANPGLGGEGLDVQDHVSIVSGLKIPWDTGSGVPPGGKSPGFHYNAIGPQTSGVRGPADRGEPARGPTADQIVADAIGEDTPHRSLSYRVQAAIYIGANSTGGSAGRISYRRLEDGGLQAIDPIFSPQLAYSTLFGNFIPPNPAEAAAAAFRLRRSKSVIDLVREKTQRLLTRVGKEDQVRIERHLDEVRALEQRLDVIPPDGLGSCAQPPDPGEDPPIQGAAVEYQGEGGDGLGYSDEELRATVLCDMVKMAFACDLTRSAAVRMTFTQSRLQMGPLAGHEGDIHSALGHNNQQVPYADAFAWHVRHLPAWSRCCATRPMSTAARCSTTPHWCCCSRGAWATIPSPATTDCGPIRPKTWWPSSAATPVASIPGAASTSSNKSGIRPTSSCRRCTGAGSTRTPKPSARLPVASPSCSNSPTTSGHTVHTRCKPRPGRSKLERDASHDPTRHFGVRALAWRTVSSTRQEPNARAVQTQLCAEHNDMSQEWIRVVAGALLCRRAFAGRKQPTSNAASVDGGDVIHSRNSCSRGLDQGASSPPAANKVPRLTSSWLRTSR